MVKRILHVMLALAFPCFVLVQLLIIILFTDNGFGNKWIPDSKEMIDILNGRIK